MERNNKKAVKKNNRIVHFSHIVIIHTLDDEDEDIRSEWMRYAIDR